MGARRDAPSRQEVARLAALSLPGRGESPFARQSRRVVRPLPDARPAASHRRARSRPRRGQYDLPAGAPDNGRWARGGGRERAPNEGGSVMWQDPEDRLTLLELLARGVLKRRRAQAS